MYILVHISNVYQLREVEGVFQIFFRIDKEIVNSLSVLKTL